MERTKTKTKEFQRPKPETDTRDKTQEPHESSEPRVDQQSASFVEPGWASLSLDRNGILLPLEMSGRNKIQMMQQLQRSVGNQAVQRLFVQRVAGDESQVDEITEKRIRRESGGGPPLNSSVQRQMSQAFGFNFSNVRVHTSAESNDLNHRLGAVAFTTGRDIFFREGAYNPHSHSGQEVIAHELTHVVQQSTIPSPGSDKMQVSQPEDASERQAEQVAHLVTSGEGVGAVNSRTEPSVNRWVITGLENLIQRQGDEGTGGSGGGPPAPTTENQPPGAEGANQGPPSAAPAQTPPGVARPIPGTNSFTIKLPSVSIPADYPLGPVKYKGLKATPDITYTVTPPPAPPQTEAAPAPQEGGPKVTHSEGVTVGPTGDISYSGKIQEEWDKVSVPLLGSFTPKVSEGASIDKDGGSIGVGGTLSGEVISVGLDFKIIDVKTNQINFLTLNPKVVTPGPKLDLVLDDGTKISGQFSITYEFTFEPDWVRIGEWLVEKFGEEAAIEFGIALSFVAGAALTIGTALYQIATSGETAQRVDTAATELKNWCRSYKSVMTGGPPGEGSGGAGGANYANQAIQQSKVPPDVFYGKAKERDLYSEAYAIIQPTIRQAAIASYWDEHWFEKKIYGESGHDFREFMSVLEAAGV